MLVFGRSKEMIKAYTQAESECLASELLPIIPFKRVWNLGIKENLYQVLLKWIRKI
ncbi:hypothetical protein ACLGCI_08035 [Helicobacter pylori]